MLPRSQDVFDSVRAFPNFDVQRIRFVNETNVRVVSIDTTAVQSALCCAVWYYDAAEPGSSSSSVKKVKVKRAASVEEATNEASTSSSSLSSKKSVATSAPPLDDSGAFVDPEGGTEMQTRAIIKPKKSLPRKYAKSALRVAFKPVDYSQGETVVVKLRCKLNGDVKEHVFSAKKPTLETLGYANLDEGSSRKCVGEIEFRLTIAFIKGVVELKDLALITMHFLVDELYDQIDSQFVSSGYQVNSRATILGTNRWLVLMLNYTRRTC